MRLCPTQRWWHVGNFNPRTPRGVRQVADGPPGDCVIISIHAPREGCDKAPLAGGTKERNFNPRTPRGVRLFGVLTKNRSLDFNPRTPRGVRRGGMSAPMRGGDFNPRTPRGVRRSVMRSSICSNSISIHAPREGCDERPCCTSETGRHYFNPRTPRGVRHLLAEGQSAILEFQSTHPARGATRWCCWWRSSAPQFQSTHPARGATTGMPWRSSMERFQSTHPARGATAAFRWRNSPPGNFNPRTPRGVRPVARTQRPGPNVFQSTHPARGATLRNLDVDLLQGISIHAPREGCDQRAGASQTNGNDFNPRTPRGVRPVSASSIRPERNFNPRTPRGVRRHAALG